MNKKHVNYTFLVKPKGKNVENLQESQIGLKLSVYNALILKVNLDRASGRFLLEFAEHSVLTSYLPIWGN